jgi:hypothetical protein
MSGITHADPVRSFHLKEIELENLVLRFTRRVRYRRLTRLSISHEWPYPNWREGVATQRVIWEMQV